MEILPIIINVKLPEVNKNRSLQWKVMQVLCGEINNLMIIIFPKFMNIFPVKTLKPFSRQVCSHVCMKKKMKVTRKKLFWGGETFFKNN